MKINQKQVRNSLIVAILIVVLCASSYYVGVSSSYVGDTGELWVNPPFSEASYVVGQYNSTYYYAKNCTTGKFDYLSSNASYVIQAAINALPIANARKGQIYIKQANYDIGSDITIGKKTYLIAESGTMFNVTQNLTNGAIVIDPTNVEFTDYQIKNIQIELNQYNGHGIYSANALRTDSRGKASIENIYIRNVKSGYGGITLTNLFLMKLSNINIFPNYGTGIWLKLDDTLISGNSIFENILTSCGGANAIGVDIEKSAVKHYCLINFNRLQIGGDPSSAPSGSIGFRANGLTSTRFMNLDIEGAEKCMVLDSCTSNIIDITGIQTNAASGYGIQLINTCYNNIFRAGLVNVPNGLAYSDETAYTSNPNQIQSGRWHGTFALGTNTALGQCSLWDGSTYRQTVKNGVATIIAGNTYTTVTVNYPLSDYRVTISPSSDTGGKRFWVSDKTQTSFRITIDSIYASNISFEWAIEYVYP